MFHLFAERRAKKNLKKNYKQAEKLIKNEEKLERFLQRVEKKLRLIPRVGRRLSTIPVMISLVTHYYTKEYRHIPIGSIIAITSALIYFLSPIDIIPDFLPFIGFLDDAAVVATAWKLIDSDVKEYRKWQKENGKLLNT